jgi:hypothetical protein
MASKDRAVARRSSALSLEKTSSPFDTLRRVEVGTVRREIEQPHPGIFEALVDSRDFMRWQVISHNDASRSHFGDQAFFELLLQDFAPLVPAPCSDHARRRAGFFNKHKRMEV